MSAHREVEISCDGPRGEPFECTESLPTFHRNAFRARREAREAGWLVGQPGGKDYCPAHRASRLPVSDGKDTDGAH